MHNIQRRLAEARTNDRGSAALAVLAALGTIIVVVGLIVLLTWQGESFGSTDGGHVAVVRNGGPFDNTKIRQVLTPSSGRTNIGMYSTMHDYPVSQRYFTISSSGTNADANESVVVPTADGVQVGIEGTAYFTLNTSPADKYRVLKDFDNKYGTRTFRCTGTKDSKHVYDGDSGFSCFLDQIVSPIINNDLRVSVGDLRCADLVASCSLVQNTTGTASIDQTKVGQGNHNLGKIESDISSSLQQDLNQTLGGNFLQVERFNLAKVDLPQSVQKAIDDAQSNFASVTQAQAEQKKALIQAQTRLQQAKIDSQANDARQSGYNNCPACQQIDILKALPQGITVYAPGNGSGVSLAVPK